MFLEPNMLIAWVSLLLVGLVGFVITMTLRTYGLTDRPTKDMNTMFLECFILIAWVALLLVGVIVFTIGGGFLC